MENNILCTPEVSPELIARAEFLANDLMKVIPEEKFTKKRRAFLEKENELQERNQRILNLDLFDVRKIPEETIRKCLDTLFIPEEVNRILSNEQLFEENARKLIYVGWVYANCFLKPDGTYTQEKETFTVDFMDFELDGGGYHATGRNNITHNIEFCRMDAMIPCLKGVPL